MFPQQNANYRIPTTTVNKLISTGSFTHYLVMQKIDPKQPWGDMDFTFTVDNYDSHSVNVKYWHNWRELRMTRSTSRPQTQ